MNIHFTDKELFNKLMHNKIVQIEMGSKLYGLKDSESDTDYLIVYSPFSNQSISPFSNHHQLQYKESNCDYIFIDLLTFIKNCVNGDSTINFEVINSEMLIGTPLEFLYHNRFAFYNYKILRSYLGLARRDLNHLFKPTDNRPLTNKNVNKKLLHAIRGYFTANQIYLSLLLDRPIYKNIQSDKIYNWFLHVKELKDDKIKNSLKQKYSYEINKLREELNLIYDTTDFIPSYMIPECQHTIDTFIYELLNTHKNSDFIDMELFYNSNENDVNY